MAERQHETPEECKADFLQCFEDITENPMWMGAVWAIGPNGEKHIMRTTCAFPKAGYMEAVLGLKELLDKEVGLSRPEPITPLEVAQHVQDIREDKYPSTGMLGIPGGAASRMLAAEFGKEEEQNEDS